MLLNSNLVSAQNRPRLYWFNWDAPMPTDRGIVVADILDSHFDEKYILSEANHNRLIKGNDLKHRFSVIDPIKANCMVARQYANAKGNFVSVPRSRVSEAGLIRVGSALDIKGHDYNKRVYSAEGKAPSLAAKSGGNLEPKIDIANNVYRKLMPVECERLQTLPDGYTEGVSDSQRYKMLGNGWTVDAVVHLFQHAPFHPAREYLK